jgi:hypothetical protein
MYCCPLSSDFDPLIPYKIYAFQFLAFHWFTAALCLFDIDYEAFEVRFLHFNFQHSDWNIDEFGPAWLFLFVLFGLTFPWLSLVADWTFCASEDDAGGDIASASSSAVVSTSSWLLIIARMVIGSSSDLNSLRIRRSSCTKVSGARQHYSTHNSSDGSGFSGEWWNEDDTASWQLDHGGLVPTRAARSCGAAFDAHLLEKRMLLEAREAERVLGKQRRCDGHVIPARSPLTGSHR